MLCGMCLVTWPEGASAPCSPLAAMLRVPTQRWGPDTGSHSSTEVRTLCRLLSSEEALKRPLAKAVDPLASFGNHNLHENQPRDGWSNN